MEGLQKETSCRGLFKALNMLTLPGIYMYQTKIYAKNSEEQLAKNLDIHQYNTRKKNNIHLDLYKGAFSKNNPIHAGSKLLNNLPNNIKNIKDLKKFKKELRRHLINEEPYEF